MINHEDDTGTGTATTVEDDGIGFLSGSCDAGGGIRSRVPSKLLGYSLVSPNCLLPCAVNLLARYSGGIAT